MPSLLKTAFLQLNKWAGNEYPKREDFVSDNEKIDAFADDISSQMAQINIERGYLKSKILTSENDLNNIVLNGKYWVNGSVNTPVYGGSPRTQGYLDITSINGSGNDDGYSVQKYVTNSLVPLHFERTRANGTWSDWFLISKAITPTETVITSGFASGITGTIRCRKNQEGLLTFRLALNSNVAITVKVLCTLPLSYRPTADCHFVTQLQNTSSNLLDAFATIIFGSNGDVVVSNVFGTQVSDAKSIYAPVFSMY